MRTTVKLGGISLTISPSGITTSVKAGGVRLTSNGKRTNVSITLAPGLRYTKRVK
jgi:hypothetical protein